jgi:hypothetical protein
MRSHPIRFNGRPSRRADSLRLLEFFALLLVICAMGVAPALPSPAYSESSLVVDYPLNHGVIPAATYNVAGKRVGEASIVTRILENGNVVMNVKSGFEGGASNELHAELELVPTKSNPRLRILSQRSQSFDPKGEPLIILEIDHAKGEATCTPPDGNRKKTRVVPIKGKDRVANVPLSMVFQPLTLGQTDRLDLQVFFCLGGPRLIGFTAKKADIGEPKRPGGPRLQKITYRPDGKGLLSWVAARSDVAIEFWFDPEEPGRYVAHKMPLYSGGPNVFVVRDGYTPADLVRLEN